MLWTKVNNFNLANHKPKVKTDNRVIYAKAGEEILLKADASDPNGGALSYQWVHYPETTDNDFYIDLSGENKNTIKIIVPKIAKNDIQIILKVTNSGTPPLSTYARFIIKVEKSS